MIATIADIEHDAYNAVRDTLAGIVRGAVYPSECRPYDSVEEDAVVIASTATADQIQEGRVHINVWVADIDNGSGREVPDKARIRAISGQGNAILEALNSNCDKSYLFEFAEATNILQDANNQHIVAFTFKFRKITF